MLGDNLLTAALVIGVVDVGLLIYVLISRRVVATRRRRELDAELRRRVDKGHGRAPQHEESRGKG